MSRAFLHVEVDGGTAGPGRVQRELALKGLLSELTDRVEVIGTGRLTADLPKVEGLERRARELEGRIRDTLAVAPRMGLAPNVPLARLASRAVRPSGLLVIDDAAGDRRVGELPVDALHGVGPVSARLLENTGIYTVGDLQVMAEADLARVLGAVQGARVFRAVHGRDPGFPRRTRSSERTFPEGVRDPVVLRRELARQLSGLLADLDRDSGAPPRPLGRGGEPVSHARRAVSGSCRAGRGRRDPVARSDGGRGARDPHAGHHARRLRSPGAAARAPLRLTGPQQGPPDGW
jgi:nucleotidyltransferase/DNA polymerase involved in DNA repair